MAQGKYWVFTWNNPQVDHVDALQSLKDMPDLTYALFQAEKVTTLHYQGYIEFSKLKRLTQLKRSHPTLHWERRKGSQKQAIDYCRKEESRFAGPYEWGTPSESSQGARTDLSTAISSLKSGGIRALAADAPEALVRYSRGLLFLDSLTVPPKPAPEVILLFGPTGTGKTRCFYDGETPDQRYAAPVTDGLWFDGYYSHEAVLFDDFNGRLSKMGLAHLLRLLDRYDLQVPIKGGFRWFVPKRIYLTSNFHPRDWYDYSARMEQYAALKRRFHRVMWWRRDAPSLPVTLSPPNVDGSIDLTDDNTWDHFWLGPTGAQLELDKESGKLVANAPANYYDF